MVLIVQPAHVRQCFIQCNGRVPRRRVPQPRRGRRARAAQLVGRRISFVQLSRCNHHIAREKCDKPPHEKQRLSAALAQTRQQ